MPQPKNYKMKLTENPYCTTIEEENENDAEFFQLHHERKTRTKNLFCAFFIFFLLILLCIFIGFSIFHFKHAEIYNFYNDSTIVYPTTVVDENEKQHFLQRQPTMKIIEDYYPEEEILQEEQFA